MHNMNELRSEQHESEDEEEEKDNVEDFSDRFNVNMIKNL